MAEEAHAEAAESAKQACYTLRLALNDLGASAEGAPGESVSAFDLSEWTQDAAGSVMEVAGSYGDCCTHISAGFTLSLLHEHGCDHVVDFPKLVKKDWPRDAKSAAVAVRSFRKDY